MNNPFQLFFQPGIEQKESSSSAASAIQSGNGQ
jgi:hypothetical protein